MIFSQEQINEINRLKRETDISWNKLARMYGLSAGNLLRYWIDEDWRIEVKRRALENKKRRKENEQNEHRIDRGD